MQQKGPASLTRTSLTQAAAGAKYSAALFLLRASPPRRLPPGRVQLPCHACAPPKVSRAAVLLSQHL